jgi:hypothetical protein
MSDPAVVPKEDVSVNVEGWNEMEIPGHASGSTPMGVEVRDMISEAGEVTRVITGQGRKISKLFFDA